MSFKRGNQIAWVGKGDGSGGIHQRGQYGQTHCVALLKKQQNEKNKSVNIYITLHINEWTRE